jgi:hypothetical protein
VGAPDRTADAPEVTAIAGPDAVALRGAR